MGNRVKTAPIAIYVAPELKDAAEKTAKANARSLTGLIEKLLMEAATGAGFWPPKGKARK
jgi:hypothetical protein